MSYIEKNGKFNHQKWARENIFLENQVLSENYVKDIDADGDIGAGIQLIKDAWHDWAISDGISQKEIKPAKKELLNYILKWLNKDLK